MDTPPPVEQIIHCLKYDMAGDLIAGAIYAERIARMNGPSAENYAEAARRLRAQDIARRARYEAQEREDMESRLCNPQL